MICILNTETSVWSLWERKGKLGDVSHCLTRNWNVFTDFYMRIIQIKAMNIGHSIVLKMKCLCHDIYIYIYIDWGKLRESCKWKEKTLNYWAYEILAIVHSSRYMSFHVVMLYFTTHINLMSLSSLFLWLWIHSRFISDLISNLFFSR